MELGQHLEQRQTQSLVITPQLRQLLRLVQMNNQELASHINEQLESNPLLERQSDPDETARIDGASAPGSAAPASGASAFDAMDTVAQPMSLREHVSLQISIADAMDQVRNAALALVGELQDDGYLRADPDDLAVQLGLSRDVVDAAIALVQTCEPTGIGARDLNECLCLQLAEQGALCTQMTALLARLQDVSTGRIEALCRDLDIGESELGAMMSVIRGLDPRPGLRFSTDITQLAVPDVFVRPDPQGGWRVELNTETLPRVLVNNQYAARIDTLKDEERAYISDCKTRANWLVNAMEQRARTILSVASEIVKLQAAFFAGGVGDLRPLTQREIAENLSIHESTVSRAGAGKFLSCSQGNFPFQFFFSKGIAKDDGEAQVSSHAVQDQIRKLISDEDPKKTLSDDKIVTILKGRGLSIARRTVTKYREALNLPSSVQRRRMNALKMR